VTRVGLQVQKQTSLDYFDYLLWRPVDCKTAQLWEVKLHWTLDDLMTFHEKQDIKEALEEEARLTTKT
jgi:hypothetical protein